MLIAVASTVVLVVGAVVGLTSTPGWPRVQETFFEPARAWSALPAVATGLWLNIRVMLVCGVLIVVFGLTLAILRTLRGPVFFPLRAGRRRLHRPFPRAAAAAGVFLLGFGVPALRLRGLPSDPLVWGGAALVLTYSAYVAEVFRAGIESVHPSQRAAARSLGLSYAAVDALRRAAAGRPAGRAAPAERPGEPAEGLGADRRPRGDRRDPLSSDRDGHRLQLHPLRRRRVLFMLLTIPLARVTD